MVTARMAANAAGAVGRPRWNTSCRM
jgi:hypothetical protein